MEDVIFIIIKHQVEEVIAFAMGNTETLHMLTNWHGRSKISIKWIKYQARCDFDLSMQGCDRARVETGYDSALAKTDGVDLYMNITSYKRPVDAFHKRQSRP